MTDAYSWSKMVDVVNTKEKLNKVTKQDIIDFANKYFRNNYVVIYGK